MITKSAPDSDTSADAAATNKRLAPQRPPRLLMRLLSRDAADATQTCSVAAPYATARRRRAARFEARRRGSWLFD